MYFCLSNTMIFLIDSSVADNKLHIIIIRKQDGEKEKKIRFYILSKKCSKGIKNSPGFDLA